MRHLSRILYGTILFGLFGCNTTTSPAEDIVNETQKVVSKFNATYQPPVFEEDERKGQINDAAVEFERIFSEHADARRIPGIAYGVVVDGELVVSGGLGMMNLEKQIPASTNGAFRIASMTKSFIAMGIVKLRDEGKLSLQDPVAKYLPEMAELSYLTKDAPPIDIANLITMTSGLPEDNPWGDRQLDETNEMLIDLIAEGLSFSSIPAFQYEYSNLGFAMAGNIISTVSGIPYQQYIKENIFDPLGMNNTYFEIDDVPSEQLAIGYRWEDEKYKLEPMLHDGSFGAIGGIITTIEDFSKYVSYQLSAWPARSQEETGPVKRSSLREMQTPQFSRLYANGRDEKGEPCPYTNGYGYGLSIVRNCNGRKRVSHGGALPGFGSNYIFYPNYGVGVMAFGNLTYTGPLPYAPIEDLLFNEINLSSRELPVSDILKERQAQVVELIQNWDASLEEKILAENFYLDQSREHRMAQAKEVLEKAGAIKNMEPFIPYNNLRGRFYIETENGRIRCFFSLSPEKEPKVQRLVLSFEES